MVGQESCPALNRTADVAHLKGNGPKDDDPLPPLLDCRLSWMSTGGFVLSGIAAEGDALYAQSWWCRPL
ncbi:TPA: hypothetical protein QDB07_000831 [Burkholderia vietnamiensis]|nr:hypothetical protein [Burkholderia vietnamiensis]